MMAAESRAGVTLLFAEDIAEKFGMSASRAHRWLCWLEREHGARVVGRMPSQGGGVRRYTTEAALQDVGPSGASRLTAVEQRVEEVAETVLDVVERVRKLEG